MSLDLGEYDMVRMVRLSAARVAELDAIVARRPHVWHRRFARWLAGVPAVAAGQEYLFLMSWTPAALVLNFIETEPGTDWFNERTKADWRREAGDVYDSILESVKGGA